MRALEILSPGYSVIGTLYFIGLVLFSAVLVQSSWTGVEKLIKWKKTPNPKNVSLSYLPLTNNEIRLKVKNLEFRKPQTIISKIEIGISGQKNWLSVIHNNSALKYLKSVEVPFVKLNPKENTFSVIYPDNESLEKFGYGVYKFDVLIQYGFSTTREGLLSRYIVVVEFGGGVLKIVSLSTPAT